MSMKKFALVSLLMACLPLWLMAQTSDDLYFIPKKKTEKKVTSGTPAKVVIEKDNTPTMVYASPGSTVVVKDVNGELRDVDEYNRRYTSRDNTFSMENDTLYIEEKPYNERGEWVNGFEGTQSDYEYAMRIVRFRNPRYAIPVSSPLYWDVVYSLPSWEWNVFNDGLYAYAFPTYSNPLWWDWRVSYSWGWHSPWYYNSWYGPGYWYGGYWGGWPHHHHHWGPVHHYPSYAWGGVGGYWGGGHGWNGSSARNPGIHAGRYTNNYRGNYATAKTSNSRRVATSGNRNSRDNYVNGVRQSNNRNGNTVRNSGRVVTAKDGSTSVRPQRSAVRGRNNTTVNNRETTGVRANSVYTRPTEGKASSYNRQSSTRSTVNNTSSGSSYQRRSGAAERGAYRSNSSSGSSSNNRSYNNSSSSSSSSRSSYSSGSSSSRSSNSSGGGSSSSRSSSGSGGRSSGGRR